MIVLLDFVLLITKSAMLLVPQLLTLTPSEAAARDVIAPGIATHLGKLIA